MALQNAYNSVKSKALGVAESLTPVLKESKFKDTGVITPDEFVAAGDYIVHHCPTWRWAEGEEGQKKSYLPSNKQFLITKNVPCFKRCADIEQMGDYKTILDDDKNGGWVDITNQQEDKEGDDEMKETEVRKEAPVVDDNDDDDDEAMDMEAFEEAGMFEDAATLASAGPASQKGMLDVAANMKDGILNTRTYDLSVTYDKYYQTPRLWLFGYNEERKPLSEEEMNEDISQDHLNKTVTVEAHPHLPPPPMASIHPCKHAEVMKKIIQTVEDGGGEIVVHMYLLIFLKFVQSVIPTVEYDYTRNFKM